MSVAIPLLPQYSFMAWYLVKKHRGNFTFTFRKRPGQIEWKNGKTLDEGISKEQCTRWVSVHFGFQKKYSSRYLLGCDVVY
jgi:hypothetical protein